MIGHGRSGTTNVQKALGIKGTCGTYYDLVFPSLTLKYLFWPLKYFVHDFVFRRLINGDIKNHMISIDEEIEEHMLLFHLFEGNSMAFLAFKPLRESQEFLDKSEEWGFPYQFDFIKRCIARNILFRNARNSVYVGGPIHFATVPHELRLNFPQAKFVICMRNPVDVVPSHVDLFISLNGGILNEKIRQERLWYFKVMTTTFYTQLSRFNDSKEGSYWMDFENWKSDSSKEIKKIWTWLGWSFSESESKIASKRSEKHKNRPESYDLIPKEEIEQRVGAQY